MFFIYLFIGKFHKHLVGLQHLTTHNILVLFELEFIDDNRDSCYEHNHDCKAKTFYKFFIDFIIIIESNLCF